MKIKTAPPSSSSSLSIPRARARQAAKFTRALVRNRAQLAYPSVGAWLEGQAAPPDKVAANADLAAQLKLQDAGDAAPADCRFQHGALDLETIETRPVMLRDQAVDIASLEKNRATSLIEEFMVAANGVIARTFEDAASPPSAASCARPSAGTALWSLLRAWERSCLPIRIRRRSTTFCLQQKQKDPDRFPDLSLAVVKLLGPGEYFWSSPISLARPLRPCGTGLHPLHRAQPPLSRRGDAASAQGVLAKRRQPYTEDELDAIAQRCTQMEDAARKVERDMQKRIAAVVLRPSSSARASGHCHRRHRPRNLRPHPGSACRWNAGERGEAGARRLDVGDRVTVKLVATIRRADISTSQSRAIS